MEMTEKSMLRRWPEKLYGGLKMSWRSVLLLALGSALLTAVFLLMPIFKDSSFERMGVYLEAWIFLAVVIMANCKSPRESALKTFVFFLVSQPLIYLFQVPFSSVGWQIFRYYRYWFIWTLLTLPMAYIGWYITKKNWLSVLIFSPVLVFLGHVVYQSGAECLQSFPHLLITALFCILQIVLYVIVFFPDLRQKIVGVLIPLLAIVFFAVLTPQVDLTSIEPLPGEPSFSAAATVSVEDASIAEVQLNAPEEGVVYLYAHKYGVTELTVTDAGTDYRYSVEVYDENGVDRIRIMPLGQEPATK